MNRQLPTVDDFMQTEPTVFSPDDDIHEAIKVLLDLRISGAPVVDKHGQLIGILSKKDCFKVIYSSVYHREWGGQVSEYMSIDVATVEAGTDVLAVADRFLNTHFRRFPVLKQGRMVGLITRHDILRALEEQWSS